jgi:hypothetical protein
MCGSNFKLKSTKLHKDTDSSPLFEMTIGFKLKQNRKGTKNSNHVSSHCIANPQLRFHLQHTDMLSILSKVTDVILFQENQIAQDETGVFGATIRFHVLCKSLRRIYKLTIRAPMDASLRNKMMTILRRREIYSILVEYSGGKLYELSSEIKISV